MNIFKASKDSTIKLQVKITSDGIVGSNVNIEDHLVRKSTAYSFTIDLGNSDEIVNKRLSVVSNFFAYDNIDGVMRSTEVSYTLKDKNHSQDYIGEVIKLDDHLFTIYVVINLKS